VILTIGFLDQSILYNMTWHAGQGVTFIHLQWTMATIDFGVTVPFHLQQIT